MMGLGKSQKKKKKKKAAQAAKAAKAATTAAHQRRYVRVLALFGPLWCHLLVATSVQRWGKLEPPWFRLYGRMEERG